MKTKFTTEEIKEWLEGWYVVDDNGGIKAVNGCKVGLGLESILVLLECDQDGIKAYFERKAYVNDEQQNLSLEEYKDLMNKGYTHEKD